MASNKRGQCIRVAGNLSVRDAKPEPAKVRERQAQRDEARRVQVTKFAARHIDLPNGGYIKIGAVELTIKQMGKRK